MLTSDRPELLQSPKMKGGKKITTSAGDTLQCETHGREEAFLDRNCSNLTKSMRNSDTWWPNRELPDSGDE